MTVEFSQSANNRSPVEYVISMNMQGGLTPSQRAAIAADLVELFKQPATHGEKGKFTARENRVAEVCHTDEPEKAARRSARG